MAINTSAAIRQQLIYQIFPRNYSSEGTFQEIIADLPRIKKLGVDIIYLLPIHPIGTLNRKGDMGSPYAIIDYYTINSEYGTLSDFQQLIEQTHKAGMKLMMDIVINHTAPDHVYTTTHPDYYYRKKDGKRGNKVGDWTDIVDLDYTNQDLWHEMTKMLVYWATLGVDGYRCDVASFVPISFWLQARLEVAKVKPDFIWLAESVHKEFLQFYRNQGYLAHSDSEVYQAFDICYDYDIHHEWLSFMQGKKTIYNYAQMLNLQECIYPMNYSKLRFLENHDQPRIHELTKDKQLTRNWVAFSFFQKGTAFLYAGQEAYATHHPDLFTKDTVDLTRFDSEYESLIRTLSSIKKKDIIASYTSYSIQACNDEIMQVVYENETAQLIGFFPLKKAHEVYKLPIAIADGTYNNQITGALLAIEKGMITVESQAIIIGTTK